MTIPRLNVLMALHYPYSWSSVEHPVDSTRSGVLDDASESYKKISSIGSTMRLISLRTLKQRHAGATRIPAPHPSANGSSFA